MGVQRIEPGPSASRADGPSLEVLIGEQPDDRLGAVQVVVPPGAKLPAHDHGESETLLVPLAGAVRLVEAEDGGTAVDLRPGVLGNIPVGQRVELHNAGEEEARLLAVFSPADFATRLRG